MAVIIMKKIGLTGGIATGKSTVSSMLRKKGYEVIDADAIVHDLQVAGSPFLQKIVKIFGAAILNKDGSLNRKELGQVIFNDAEARAKLDEMIHPAVRAEFERLIAATQNDLLFLDVPLLFEAGFDDLAEMTLVIIADQEVQLKRLMKRDGLSLSQAQARIDAQMTLDEKIMRADFVIDNSSDKGTLEEKVEKILGRLKGKGD